MPQGMRAKMPPLDINAGFFYAPAHNGINSAAIRIAGIWRTAFYKYMLWVRAVRPRIFYIISQGVFYFIQQGKRQRNSCLKLCKLKGTDVPVNVFKA